MPVSRPCYDKPRRCPGWAGGGWRYAKEGRRVCPGAYLEWEGRRLWRWRWQRCGDCGIRVLPLAVRYVDPTWWGWRIRWRWSDWRYWRSQR